MDYNEIYRKLLTPGRVVKEKTNGDGPEAEFANDRSRIIYSSNFRAMQQKTQVFPLEMNRTVRTRLVHCIEVADIGRRLSMAIVQKLRSSNIVTDDILLSIPTIVENACLMHDIGNPPFGHFGETAIKQWFFDNSEKFAKHAGVDLMRATPDSERYQILIHDLQNFDGNQQGIRIGIHIKPSSSGYPMNLTYQTILSAIKYPYSTADFKGNGSKKAGFFEVEKTFLVEMQNKTGLEPGMRFPLSYITEAADDLAYCMSDIDDGIEKKLLSPQEFISEFQNKWRKLYPSKEHKVPDDLRHSEYGMPVKLPPKTQNYYFGREISAKWTKYLIEKVADSYIQQHDAILNGRLKQLIGDQSDAGRVLTTLKSISRSSLYTANEVISLELAGLKAIRGLLECYSCLLELTKEQFGHLICESKNTKLRGRDIEWRVYNKIAKRFVATYKCAVIGKISDTFDESEFEKCYKNISTPDEWVLRAHMIIDHIVCMTDDYAIAQYKMIQGII